MRTVITTVGTSLLNHAKNQGKDPQDYLRTAEREGTLDQTSAETNSLERLLQKGDRIVFLHSDTDEGEQAARLLADFYREKGHATETRKVSSLKYDEKQFAQRGLRAFVTELINHVEAAQRAHQEVLINATGGFKAEFAYALLVGLLYKVPVYYIHEKFREIISLPPIPIGWNFQLIDDYEAFFEWIEQDLRTTREVENWLYGMPEAVRLLLTDEDGYTVLSPAGEAFYRAYRKLIEEEPRTPAFLHKQAKRALLSADDDTRQELHRRISRLQNSELGRQNSEHKRNSDCLFYPTGRFPYRIAYYTDANGIWICAIFTSHDRYEAALEKGIYSKDYDREDFEPYEGLATR
ncbi:MAG: putative CRISPR-associated protein [Fimbriimonadales bacterium]|nr:MAG: hypothetical protein KatS3mg018_1915 [Fimbriimonadales bacterium]